MSLWEALVMQSAVKLEKMDVSLQVIMWSLQVIRKIYLMKKNYDLGQGWSPNLTGCPAAFTHELYTLNL